MASTQPKNNKLVQTIQIIRHISQQTDSVVLFYSGGKDSLVLLDLIAPYFKKIYCVYQYDVPNMGWFQPYRDWVKKYPNAEFLEVPSFQWYTFKAGGTYCQPIVIPNKPKKRSDIDEAVKQKLGCRFSFSGVKGVDGFMKRMRLKMWAHDYYTSPKGEVYPLAIWTNKEVHKYLKTKNLIKPFHFSNISDSSLSQGFGITPECLLLLHDRYPEDYKRVLKEFPFADLVLYQDANLTLDNQKWILDGTY